MTGQHTEEQKSLFFLIERSPAPLTVVTGIDLLKCFDFSFLKMSSSDLSQVFYEIGCNFIKAASIIGKGTHGIEVSESSCLAQVAVDNSEKETKTKLKSKTSKQVTSVDPNTNPTGLLLASNENSKRFRDISKLLSFPSDGNDQNGNPDKEFADYKRPRNHLPGVEDELFVPNNPSQDFRMGFERASMFRMKKSVPYRYDCPCFIFEVPHHGWSEVGKSDREILMGKGPFDSTRLQYMEKIVVVPQSLESLQLTYAKSLRIPHYQIKRGDVLDSLPCSVPVDRVALFDSSFPESMDRCHFIESRIREHLTNALPWREIFQHVVQKASVSPSGEKRQQFHISYGFSGGEAYARDPVTGMTGPSVCKGTADPFIIGLFEKFSGLVKQELPFCYKGLPMERGEEFAKSIHPSNIFEGITLVVSEFDEAVEHGKSLELLCNIHEDILNSQEYPEVVIATNLFKTGDLKKARCGIIGYQRVSGDTTMARKSTIEPPLQQILSVYEMFTDDRKDIPTLLRGLSWRNRHSERAGSEPYQSVPCHLDPAIFLSPILHYTMLAHERFTLDYLEICSLMRAFMSAPYTTYYYVTAMSLLLDLQSPPRGFELGYWVYQRMYEYVTLDESDPQRKIPGLRHAKYKISPYLKFRLFKYDTKYILFVQVKTVKFFNKPTNQVERMSIYSSYIQEFNNTVTNCADLVCNNVAFVFSGLGLTPLWFAGEYFSKTTPRGITHLQLHYGLPKGQQSMNSFYKTVAVAVSAKENSYCSKRKAENIVCKCFRMEQGSENKFCDLVYFEQRVFNVEKEGMVIHKQNGDIQKQPGPLITKFMWNGNLVLARELYSLVGEDVLTSPIGVFEVPEELRKRNLSLML